MRDNMPPTMCRLDMIEYSVKVLAEPLMEKFCDPSSVTRIDVENASHLVTWLDLPLDLVSLIEVNLRGNKQESDRSRGTSDCMVSSLTLAKGGG